MAKILLATYSMYGAWFTLQLEAEGHTCDIWLMDHYDDYSMVLDGLVSRPFKTKPDFKRYDLVLFDLTGRPNIAEEVRSLGIPLIGDGDLNTELEEDRLLGIQIMEQCDINVPFYQEFSDLQEAKKFVRKTNKQYVFKPNGGQDQDTATTYVSKSAEDMLKYFDKLSTTTKGVEFILQEVVAGTEISTEAWFDGSEFHCINATLEEKKFMNGGKGPNTGCAGNLIWLYDQVNPPLVYREGLEKLRGFLQGYNYRGMIDLNTIVSDNKLYGLEWTPRFGYDASATLYSCIKNLGDFLGAIASGVRPDYEITNNYAAGVRLSIPPYPSEIRNKHPEEIPVDGIPEEDIVKKCYLYDVCCDGEDLVTCGASGLVAVPIQTGDNAEQAWDKVTAKVDRISIPDVQYRTDLKESTLKRYKTLALQGWLR